MEMDNNNKQRTFTRKQIMDSHDNEGKLMLIYDSQVYDVTSWAPRHPGGQLVIQHMIGRDATDQIRINHSDEVIRKMAAFHVGRVAEGDPMINRPLSMAFRQLNQKLRDEGYYETDYWFYAKHYARFLSLMVLSIVTLLYWGHTFVGCTLGAVLMGFFWQQMAFVAHDTGHNGVTHNRKIDSFFGILLGNFLGGISIGWWKGSHNVHHLVTNDPEHDPDIQLLPVISVTNKFFDSSIFSSFHRRQLSFDRPTQLLVSIQHLTYYPVMLLGRFNLYRESFVYLFKNKTFLRELELVALLTFWAWFLTLVSYLPSNPLRLYFILLSHMVTFILHVQITLSHFAMSTEPMKENEEYIRYQLRTTLDVDCPTWFDWFHGGLQFQLVHHLFPRMPRHNLRRVRDLLLPFFKKHNLEYHCVSFTDGNYMVVNHLKSIADQVGFYFHVAAKNMEADWNNPIKHN